MLKPYEKPVDVYYKKQLEITGQLDFLKLPYHKMIQNDEIPLSIGGGIGQARTFMYLLQTAHIGEVTVSVWPRYLKIYAKKNIHIPDQLTPYTLLGSILFFLILIRVYILFYSYSTSATFNTDVR